MFKRSVLVVGILAFVVSVSAAFFVWQIIVKKQEAKKKEDALNKRVETVVTTKHRRLTIEELTDKLSLTAKQVERMKPIMKEQATKRKEILKKYSRAGDQAKEAMAKEMKMFMDYYDNMYKNVLSEQQFDKYMLIREQLN